MKVEIKTIKLPKIVANKDNPRTIKGKPISRGVSVSKSTAGVQPESGGAIPTTPLQLNTKEQNGNETKAATA